jgi:hypothetical protein
MWREEEVEEVYRSAVAAEYLAKKRAFGALFRFLVSVWRVVRYYSQYK